MIKISTFTSGMNHFHSVTGGFEMFSNIPCKQVGTSAKLTVVCVGAGEFRGRKPAIDQLTIRCHLHGWKCWQGGKLDTGRN